MESPVVLDKPTEYHGSKGDERGFPFDEEDASGAWSSLAARHPDIAARLRQRPATWARKRRPSSQDPTEDFGDSFGGFDRFPFDDIPPEFREHFPAHWGRRFEEPPAPAPANPAPAPAQAPVPPQQTSPKQPEQPDAPTPLPQYGLRNTVDLGQRNPPVDAEERAQRSVSAPPDARPPMSHEPPPEGAPPGPPGNVRHIPIFVEGRDEPVVNRTDPAAHFAAPPDREQYFADDPPAFHHPPNFSRAFGTPFNKGFRQGPQPFVQQKVYPQTGFARGASPQRSNSPKPPHTEEFRHEPAQRAQPPPPQAPPQHQAPPHQAPKQQAPKQQAPQHQAPQQQAPPPAPSPPPRPQTTPADPITLILGIQTDVLNLMSEVENFTGTKKDKRYVYLDEMLTRNLIKLDNIETDGKENIRQARKEAIKCIQKCIAVLEAKAEGRTAAAAPPAPASEPAPENGEVEMKEDAKEEPMAISQDEPAQAPQQPPEQPPQAPQQPPQDQQQPPEQAPQQPSQPEPEPEEAAPPAADTRPVENRAVLVEKPEQKNEPEKPTPKKSTKGAKKRDKSKDKTAKESTKEDAGEKKLESNVDDKGDKPAPMEVDGAASQ